MVNIGLFDDFSRSVNRSGRRCAGAGFRALSITVAAAPITNPDVGRWRWRRPVAPSARRTRPGLRRIFRPGAMSSCGLAPNQAYALFRRCLAQARAARRHDAQHRSGGRPLQRRQHSLCGAGGENIAAYVGEPRLIVAEGSELFDTVKEGAVIHESPEAGR